MLGIVLALLEDPHFLALDGVDDGLDADEQQQLWTVLREVAGTGIAVLVTARRIGQDVTTEVQL